MRILLIFIAYLVVTTSNGAAQSLPSFKATGSFDEQEMDWNERFPEVLMKINAPINFHKKATTYLILFALPNGNSIEWTAGKKINAGDDWHYDIQHIAAQTRFVRRLDKKNNYIIVYIGNKQKSWPAWKRSYPESRAMIRKMVDSLSGIFHDLDPHIVLNGHSGGGSFIFGYLDAIEFIPPHIDKIAFLDSDYGYEDSLHRSKLVSWLQGAKKNTLCVLAYNDSIVIYNGKPLVSPTGGTWYRSRLLQQNLSASFDFRTTTDTAFIRHTALKGRISIILKQNPAGKIYHTVQVERNGFIYSLLMNTRYDRRKYFTYFGERSYSGYIQ